MIRLRALCTLPFPFRSLSSVNNDRVGIHRSPIFGSTQIRRFGSSNPSLVYLTLSPQIIQSFSMSYSRTLTIVYFMEECRKSWAAPTFRVLLKPMPEINGILFGLHHRPFFALATTYEQISYNLHFLFVAGSPSTYLSYDVS